MAGAEHRPKRYAGEDYRALSSEQNRFSPEPMVRFSSPALIHRFRSEQTPCFDLLTEGCSERRKI